MSWPAVLLWLVIAAGFASQGPALLYAFQIATVFGMLQMIPSGNLTFLPSSICAAFLFLKIVLQPGNLVRAADIAMDPARAGLFTAFLLYGLMTCFVLSRLFAGQVVVVPVNEIGADLLFPSSGNISQTMYMTLSFATTIGFAVCSSGAGFERHYLRAVLVGGAAVVGAGLVDLITYRTGHGAWLDPFRTASYRLLSDAEISGAKRIVGLMPEASAYGLLCIGALGTLVFLRPFYEPRSRRLYVPVIALALTGMTLISTSSSAYVGFGVLVVLYGANIVFRLASTDPLMREGLGFEFVLLAVIAFAALTIVIFTPGALKGTMDVFNEMVLNKTASSSYAERSMWTRIALQAFMDTGGLGVGLGSVRTSNWSVSILASTGLFGAVLLFGFIAYLLFWPAPDDWPPRRRQMRRALGFAIVPTLTVTVLGGTMPDIGVQMGSLYGLLVGLHERRARPAAVRSAAA